MQRLLVISYRISGQIIGPSSKAQGLLRLSKRGPIICYETSVTNYPYTVRNIEEERISQFQSNFVPFFSVGLKELKNVVMFQLYISSMVVTFVLAIQWS